MKHKLLNKLLTLTLLILGGALFSPAWGEDVLTLDCATPAPTGTTSTTLSTSEIATFLNSAAGLTNKITCSSKTGDVYKGKGNGGGNIPQGCLKIGKASGGGGFTFTIPDTYDKIDEVELTCYGWKTTSSISINNGTAQTFTTAQSETTKTFELASSTRTITIAVTTSAVCVTEIVLKSKTTTYSVTYNANDATSGDVPTDNNEYEDGDEVTVLGNTGGLAKTGYDFGGWNTQADGSGTDRAAGSTFNITENTTLYAKWTPYTITAQSNNNTYGTVTLSNFVITGSPAPGYRYADPAYTVSPENSATVVQNGNAFTVTPSANTTVTINFEAIPTYTVTLSDDTENPITENTPGAGVTLPSRSAIGSYTFAGWSETNVSEETTTAPTIIPTGTYYPTANITLYPVYSKSIGGGGVTNKSIDVNIASYAGANNWNNGTAYQPLIMDENISVGGTISGNNFKYYNSDDTWRFYTDGSFTISAANGAELSSVKIITSGTLKYGDATIISNTKFAVTGSSATISCTSNAKITYISVDYTISDGGTIYYWSAPVAATVEMPNIVVAENPFLFSTTATITCATEGAAIKYSYDGETWNDYKEPLVITEAKTIYAKAIKDENESSVAQVTATKNLATPIVTVNGDITLDLDGETDVEAGTLSATVTYNNAAVDGATVTWTSNNTDVAEINETSGVVIIKTRGTVTFTATYAGNTDLCRI